MGTIDIASSMCYMKEWMEEAMTQDFAIGDEVQITSTSVEGYDRTSKVEGATKDGCLIVRPKHFRQIVEVYPENVAMVKSIKRCRQDKLVYPLSTSEPTDALIDSGYNSVSPKVRELLSAVADEIGDEAAFGKTALFYGLIAEVNRHTDKVKFNRG